MSLHTPLDKNRLNGGCGQCGRRVPPSDQLRRCKGCELIVYCSRKCERAHWKVHKKQCKKPSNAPPVSVTAVSSEPLKPVCPSEVVVSSRLYRPIVGQEPDPEQVAFACWCCAKLLLKKTEQETEDKYIFCHTFGRRMGGPKNDKFINGRSFPSALAAATLVGVSPDKKFASTCLHCVSPLYENAQKHLRECEEWLHSAGTSCCNDLNLVVPELYHSLRKARRISLVILEMSPDFSLGPSSIGGYMKQSGDKENNNPGQFTPIPFNDPSFEVMAFPHLFPNGRRGFEGSNKAELETYTGMRLGSTDPSFRRDPDYVTFSLFRMVAFGVWNGEVIFKMKWFPAAVEIGSPVESISAIPFPC